jgi:toxin ParE1/3/4
MKTLLFTSAASNDLDEILNYIEKDRPHTATKVIQSIRSKCQLLVDHPEIGQTYPNFGNEVRGTPQQRWMIFYRVLPDSVQILRILDGSRDIDILLG